MRHLHIILITCVCLLLLGCSGTPAPIVDGWQQRKEASIYRVQPNDTIYSIAWTFGMDYQDIARYNNLREPYSVHPGQALCMSGPGGGNTHTPGVVTYADTSSAYIPVEVTSVAVAQTATYEPKQASSPAQTAAAKSTPPTKAEPVVAAAAAPASSEKVGKGAWMWPTQGKLAKGYAPSSGGNHGIDISGNAGQPIVAASSGKVVYTGSSMPGYGKLIIIKHNTNDLSAYAFNETMLVKEGESVKEGQQIGTMGKNSAGQPMLHFEVRKNGKPQNPLDYLKRNS